MGAGRLQAEEGREDHKHAAYGLHARVINGAILQRPQCVKEQKKGFIDNQPVACVRRVVAAIPVATSNRNSNKMFPRILLALKDTLVLPVSWPRQAAEQGYCALHTSVRPLKVDLQR